MGEMADYCLDLLFDEDRFGLDGFCGVATEDGSNFFGPNFNHGFKTCRVCGKGDLHWKQQPSGKWWLAKSSGEFHVCLKKEKENDKT